MKKAVIFTLIAVAVAVAVFIFYRRKKKLPALPAIGGGDQHVTVVGYGENSQPLYILPTYPKYAWLIENEGRPASEAPIFGYIRDGVTVRFKSGEQGDPATEGKYSLYGTGWEWRNRQVTPMVKAGPPPVPVEYAPTGGDTAGGGMDTFGGDPNVAMGGSIRP